MILQARIKSWESYPHFFIVKTAFLERNPASDKSKVEHSATFIEFIKESDFSGVFHFEIWGKWMCILRPQTFRIKFWAPRNWNSLCKK